MNTLIIGGFGYIGARLLDEIEADVVDLEWFTKLYGHDIKINSNDYGALPVSFFSKYKDIILLAGHSSVAMSLSDPTGCFYNNVLNFYRLANSLTQDQRLIYASSSSVYNGRVGATEETILLGQATNIYDYSKRLIDRLYHRDFMTKRIYGLRFGTVNGISKSFRPELMINKMYIDAITNGYLDVYGPSILRPILDIEDLVQFIKTIMVENPKPGIYNLASFNSSVGDISYIVGKMLEVPYYIKGETDSYDFSMSTAKAQGTTSWRPLGSVESILDGMMGMTDFGRPRANVPLYQAL